MLRSHTCGELNLTHTGTKVTLCGWVQTIRDKGSIIWIDLRDRYGITQITLEEKVCPAELITISRNTGREYVLKICGKVVERISRNPNMKTGDIEIIPTEIEILNPSLVPPFTIEDESDGGEELRMKYRYLDLRRNPVRKNLELRYLITRAIRLFLHEQNFIEIETPVLIKSTPEGARDFVVPSRMNQGQFYALPQSPQTFKQLLMVAGFDRYFQIVKCFRDEDLRADRQPEFTQLDCEMSFVNQQDILDIFGNLTKYLFKEIKGIDCAPIPKMTYQDALKNYGSDKPDIRFDMKIHDITFLAKGKSFKVFDDSEFICAINAENCSGFSRKQLDELTEFVKKPQVGGTGLAYIKINTDGTIKSTLDKFFSPDECKRLAMEVKAHEDDLVLILAGEKNKTLSVCGKLRLEIAGIKGLRQKDSYAPLWVIDFPLLEWNEEDKRFYAMHHPFTSPKLEDIPLLETDPVSVRAIAHDLVINGIEIGGGSIRIHDKQLQAKMFKHLGFSDEEAISQFGFLMNAFQYGAPPHGGVAFGFDRLSALFGGSDLIRDFIAFPKNNSGRDIMIDSPSEISKKQKEELGI